VASGPQLSGLTIADAPERWHALGFAVGDGGVIAVGGVALTVHRDGEARGITGWTLSDLPPAAAAPAPAEHSNGVIAVDHVVIVTPDFDAGSEALAARGLALRRVTELRGRRHGFRRAGPAIIELVQAPQEPTERFWGLTLVARDLDALHRRLAPHLSPPHDAIQPGRRIATLEQSAGLSTRLAFITPE
jgi:hypothetical protein